MSSSSIKQNNVSTTIITKKKARYIDPKEFQAEYDKSLVEGKPTLKLMKLFEKLCKHCANYFPQRNQCDKDATVNHALTQVWLKWDKYDSNVSDNIFSFFTTVVMNDLRNEYNNVTQTKKRKKYQHISIDAIFSGNNH